jgi:hypothetical protein
MSDQIQSLHADLDYVKSLAREGRHSPLTGGPILLLAGSVYGTAALLMYGYMQGMIPATQSVANWTWIAATVIFLGGLIFLRSGGKRAPGAASLNNRAHAAGWTGVGFGIFAFWAALALASWRLHDSNLVWLFAPAILALYGTGWTVAAAMTETKWLSRLAVASFLAAVLLGLMAGMAEMMLAYAATLYLLAGLPGYLLMRGQASQAA